MNYPVLIINKQKKSGLLFNGYCFGFTDTATGS